ncbi:tetratricopeptide repeat protein [Microscilla marina]|nr:tetratricopeptide repeat protein [Microscilla marina]
MKSFILSIVLLCFSMWGLAHTKKPANYRQLCKKAQDLYQAQPDSAIHYARKALNAAQKVTEKAYAHELIAYYSQHLGYYGMATQHYKAAYKFYHSLANKAAMLNNMAFCYNNAGNHQTAISISHKAIEHFKRLKDSTKLMHAYNLLANCYRARLSFTNADSTYKLALSMAIKRGTPQDLANLYDDMARFKEKLNEYNSAISYQQLALDTQPNACRAKKVIRLTRMIQLCLLAQKPEAAKLYLTKVNALGTTTSKALIQLYAARGLLHFINRNETAAKLSYKRCDSLLTLLSESSQNYLQQKYVHKTAYEIYHRAWRVLHTLWFYGDRVRFKPAKTWAKARMKAEKNWYKRSKVAMTLKDALVIERYRPKTQIVRQINLWWLLVITLVLITGGLLIYRKREQSLHAHTNFIKAIKASPVKGFEELSPQEVDMLQSIEGHIQGKLNTDDIKILVMVARNYKYAQISVAVGLNVGAIKTRIKRLKDQCQVKNIRDLM